MNRRAVGADTPPLNPGEELTLESALSAYTRGSHVLLGLDDGGVLRVGARADICIADRNPFAGPTDRIGLTRTRVTIARGEVVHSSDPDV